MLDPPHSLVRLAVIGLLTGLLGSSPAADASGTVVYLPLVRARAPLPTIASFTASPPSVAPGEASTLSWSTSGATSLSITPGVGPVGGEGSVAVRPTTTTEYTLTATGADGSVLARAAVMIPFDGEGSAGKLFLPSASNATRPAIELDASSGVHVAFSHASSGGGVYPAQYAYCAAACGSAANWASAIVGNEGVWGGDVKLALDPLGRPRLVWFQQFNLSDYGRMIYATCDQACTSTANWTVTPLMEAFLATSGDYFTLDGQGRPRFAYTGAGGANYVAFCDSDCTNQSSWTQLRIDSAGLDPFVLGLLNDDSGRLHLAFTTWPSGGTISFGYGECATDCSSITSWRFLTNIFDVSVGYDLSMQVDAQGRPRVGIYTGYDSDTPAANDLLHYLWCDTGCTGSSAAWGRARVPLPPDYGSGVALAIDRQGRPRMAYNVNATAESIYGLGYAWCDASCESPTGVWHAQLTERIDDLGGQWLHLGLRTAMALDAAGNPRISYDAEQCCGGRGVKLVRFAQFNRP